MKIKVTREFKDKELNGELQVLGTELEREERRAKEIIEAGYAKEIKTVQKTKVVSKTKIKKNKNDS